MKRIKLSKLIRLALVLLVLGGSTRALADQHNETELSTITVTAQKIEEDVQDIPVSISVFDEYAINDRSMDTIEDIAFHTSGLKLTDMGGNGILTPSMRGIGADPILISSTLGVYIDGVPSFNTIGLDAVLEDIERIEVLKGPQGTLYGKNAQTGVINIITKKPNNLFMARLSPEVGSDSKRSLSAAISGPVVKDKFFIGVSGRYYEKDGFIDNTYLNTTDDDRENVFGKVYLRLTPNENLELSWVSSVFERNDGGPSIISATNTERTVVQSNLAASNDASSLSHALNIRYDMGQYRFESVTAYKIDKERRNADWDNSPQTIFHGFIDFDYENTSQEFRLSSQTEKFKWLVGLFGNKQEEEGGNISVSDFRPDSRSWSELEGHSVGVFGHADYQLTDAFSVLGGLRYDWEEKELHHHTQNLTLSDTYEQISPKIALKYRFTDTVMTYATVAKGHLSGGYYMFAPRGFQSYDSETLWNYELGLKSQLPDRRLQINTAVYYMDISDKQVQTALSPLVGYVSNAASATVMGCELDIDFKLTPEISLFASFGLSESEFEDFTAPVFDPATGLQTGTTDLDGNAIPFTPEYNFNLGAQFRSPSGWFARAEIGGYGDMYLNQENVYKQDSHTLVNARVGYETERLDIYLYGDNVFDEEYDAVGYFSGFYTIVSPPREVGVRMNIRF